MKKQEIKTVNIRMTTHNCQQPNVKKQSKQIARTRTQSQIWRSFGGLSAGRGKGENERKGTGNKKHNQLVQNRQGEVKNSIGNREAKELICTTHGHELKQGMLEGRRAAGQRGNKGEKNWGKL